MTAVLTPASGEQLQLSSRIRERLQAGELTREQIEEFASFLARVDRELMRHRIITDNAYTRWFAKGEATDDELRYFMQQFSVFSNQFLIASLLKVVNAPSMEQARASKEILLNELGVIYRRPDAAARAAGADGEADTDREGDPELVSTEGTVDGGIFRFRAAHFEWLLNSGSALGLGWEDLGQRRHGSRATLHFCDELQRLYGSEDAQIAEGASFAVENWAAAGFWQELEDGLTRIKQARIPNLKLAFFSWHNRVEQQHAGHTMEELEEVFFSPGFDREKFFQGGREVLASIAVFWDGLEQDRRAGKLALLR